MTHTARATVVPRPHTWALKVTMAVTGIILVLFIALHLFGNMKAYIGPAEFDSYALWLRHAGEPLIPAGGVLWTFRITMAVVLVIHVYGAATLWLRARRARGPYRAHRSGWRSFLASLMPLTGVLIVVFLVLHICDLTGGLAPIATANFTPLEEGGSPYASLIASLSRPWMAAIYGGVMVLLSAHVAHGITTAVQDFGAMGYRWRAVASAIAGVLALVVLVGNASLPLAIQLGVLA
ncbi:MAG: succinate dehydrogenase cytochrome b subunit [Ancrocorticia sp.]|jgi:succinate dehydrogenase / fumarate reductase cytochrome b subunit|nr:succinate dehydrogenase cytochrome b subunit [Ancrocorticia sp.]MCI1932075.1 succinate dehydrogenase cytochrome b subunit [Ancrocorticia sp.]MCI1963436.1 succinate dehydrogenase cytochrome b subunit [Ancrocorticia sp.]MCI2002370.1 succinate dehydrogenase cytochrome b subunit [Ancrocorticia sp.]MCI2012202.1 succinate dehydrogenase cytochrome b subunit [Ancrocorticia sp.]